MTADGHNFIHPLLPSSTQSMQMKRNSPPHLPTENDAKCNAVGKSHCFRMMVWLCAYYDFYDKKVYTNVIVSSYHISAHTPVALHRSLPSCCAIWWGISLHLTSKRKATFGSSGVSWIPSCCSPIPSPPTLSRRTHLCWSLCLGVVIAELRGEERKLIPYISCLCQVNISRTVRMLVNGVSCCRLLTATYTVIEHYVCLCQCWHSPTSSSFLFHLLLPDQSDTELRHSLANLLGVVLGCPTHSNHLWYHLFHPKELHGTYLTGFMVGNSRLCVGYFVVIRKQQEVRLCFLSFVHCSLINATVWCQDQSRWSSLWLWSRALSWGTVWPAGLREACHSGNIYPPLPLSSALGQLWDLLHGPSDSAWGREKHSWSYHLWVAFSTALLCLSVAHCMDAYEEQPWSVKWGAILSDHALYQ